MSGKSRKPKTNTSVFWSCSAQVDLLGFANQIALSNCDIREHLGEQAVERLGLLEQTLAILERERSLYPHLYPSGLKYLRVNDALFLGVDARHLSPPKGQIALTGGYHSLDELKREAAQDDMVVPRGTAREAAGDVAKFVGLVARIHNYINEKEAKQALPGCRTVIASGLRKRFKDRHGRDDFFAANFSLSVAYEAQERGSAAGLKGNALYLEDDVAVALTYVDVCHAILASAKFLPLSLPVADAYQYRPPDTASSVTIKGRASKIDAPVKVAIMHQEHVFRRLNPFAPTNLQLYAEYRRMSLGKRKGKEQKFGEMVRAALRVPTPSLEEFHRPLAGLEASLFVRLCFSLDTDYHQFFGGRQVAHSGNTP